ncbi:hypothetical protein GCM10023340_30010 [Nocardioides marinquilinus]|uniref:Uncharacterized protein n=1 Tax=Nocardioides marinquilinus TaxID=1210400 RepID=A0ABP9PTE5_9ACTN
MLNDIAWPTRLLMVGFGVSIGLMVAGPVAGAGSGAAFALITGGVLVEVVLLLVFPVVLGVAERRMRRTLERASRDVLAGHVRPGGAVGLVVRRRVNRTTPWFLPGRGSGPAPTAVTVLTALPDDGGPPRRVAAAVPTTLGALGRGTPAALLLHPTERDVAVLDDRVGPQRLHEIAGDPRWRSLRLPTDRTVVGGYLPLLAALVVGGVIGVVLGVTAVSLLG